MKYKNFHATLNDLTPRLQQIESQFQLKYIPLGLQKSAAGDVFTSAFAIPNFGVSKQGYIFSLNSLNDGYLVCPAGKEFVIRAVPKHDGEVLHMVDADSNPWAFGFNPGGMFESGRLIGGYIWPNSIELSQRKLCFQFSHLLLKGFEPVLDVYHHCWWVGPEAMNMLRAGDTLVIDDNFWTLALPVDERVEIVGAEVRIRQMWNMDLIRRVLNAAFQRSNEADLVEVLNRNRHLHLSLGAEIEGNLVGYLAFSPLEIRRKDRSSFGQGLGPLAVLPEFQRRGIGSALVRIGLEAMFRRGRDIIVVLGERAFYGRFGFEAGARYGIRWEHDVSKACLQVIGRRADTLNGVSGIVSYMPEFSNV